MFWASGTQGRVQTANAKPESNEFTATLLQAWTRSMKGHLELAKNEQSQVAPRPMAFCKIP